MLEKLADDFRETVFEIQIPEQEILKRLSDRRICLQCGAVYNISNNKTGINSHCNVCGSNLVIRDDDRPEVIRERYRIYLETIKPLVEHYSGKKVLFQIDGLKPIEEVFKVIKSIIEKRLPGSQRVSGGR
jgi:adenylate kinase